MFTTPAVDLAGLARRLGESGKFNRWQSRVGGLPEFNGELAAAALADEIQTPGRGQIRAFVTIAGNPVLSNPNGRRLDAALGQLVEQHARHPAGAAAGVEHSLVAAQRQPVEHGLCHLHLGSGDAVVAGGVPVARAHASEVVTGPLRSRSAS